MARIADDRYPRNAGSRLLERFEPLGRQLVRQQGYSGCVASGPSQTLRDAELDGIGTHSVDNWNRLRRLRHVGRDVAAKGKNHCWLDLNQFRGEAGKTLGSSLSVSVFDSDVLTVDIAEFAKALQKRPGGGAWIVLKAAVDQDADARAARRRRLRIRPQRPGQGTTQGRSGHEFASQHGEPPSNLRHQSTRLRR